MKLIHSIKENCTLCYACVKVCPSKAMKIEDDHAQAIHDRCIGCGHCVTVCSTKALFYHQSDNAVKQLIAENDKVVAICAPSAAGEFEDISSRRNFVGMIKALGFKHVCEAAFGADLVGHKYKDLLTNFKGKYFITTNCPSVTYYVEKYHPNTIKNLAPIVTPMIATARAVHKTYGNDVKIVYIGPCTAAKMEAERFDDDGKVDEVLTFVELRKMFKAGKITENTVEYSHFDPPRGAKGSLFPISGGLFRSVGINSDLLGGRSVSTEGRFNFIEAIKEFEDLQSLKKHIDLFYCDGGCTMGPGTSPNGKKFHRRNLVIEFTKKQMDSLNQTQWEENIVEHLKLDLSRTFHVNDQRIQTPDNAKIRRVLKDLGKEDHMDRKDCGACGYDTCVDFAVAINQGLAKPDMCISNSLANKKDYQQTLRITQEKLETTKAKLKESEINAQTEKEAVKELESATHLILQQVPSGVVMINKDLKIIHSNKRFINLLGEDAETIDEVIPGLKGADLKTLLPPTVINLFQYCIANDDGIDNRDIKLGDQLLNLSIFPVKKGEVAGAIIKDMFLPEVQREEVLSRITDVIDKNLKMVQNIGFLLGEGASETEKMLRSIIDSYKSEKK